MSSIRILAFIFIVPAVVVAQYYEWPQQQQRAQFNQFNPFTRPQYDIASYQDQQFQPQLFQQYQPQQFQPQQYQNYQQQQYQPQQQQQQAQQQAPQNQQQYQQQAPQYQQQQQQQPQQVQKPPQASPIYSQTVVIPQPPPPPSDAYQPHQFSNAQQVVPQQVAPANIPQYHHKPAEPSSASLQHIERSRSIHTFDLDNKLFREQPATFNQNQEKIELLAQPPPAPVNNQQVHVPPPPARFVPSFSTLHSIDAHEEKKPVIDYKPDLIIIDKNHSAYFEDTLRTKPKVPCLMI